MNYLVGEKKGERSVVGLREVGEGLYDVTVDGETVRVDAARTGRTIYSVIERGRQWEAMVDERGAHGFDVLVAGSLFHLEAMKMENEIVSPISGRLTHLAVSQGDTVETGATLFTVEPPREGT